MNVVAKGGGCALLALALLSAVDASYWTDTEPLFRRALARTEPNAFALFNTGMGAARRHDYDQGVADLRTAIAQQPSNPYLRRAIGYILREAKRYDEARAELTLALQLNDKMPLAWAEMGQLSIDQKRWADAVTCYTKAAALAPDNYNDHLNLAIAYRMSGQTESAMAELKQAIAINPLESKPPFMLGQLLLESSRPADAIAPLARSVSLDPMFADAQLALGNALMRSGHGDRAVGPLMAAMQLAPASPEPVSELAWLLATHPNDNVRRGEDAMFLANHAKEMMTSPSPKMLDTLAAAMAEQQQFDQAAATAAKAAELARSSGDQKLAGEIESHLQHYREHQPVRDATLAGSDAGEVVP
jgi:tetratricopeptide (TPR) repeat protein